MSCCDDSTVMRQLKQCGEAVLKNTLRKMFASAGWPILRLVGREVAESRIAVIMYHSVGGNATMSFSSSSFSDHIDMMLEQGAKFATVAALEDLKPVRDWTVCLTFDDGFADNYSVALPILAEKGVKATFFLCTGFVDQRIDISARFRNYRGLPAMNWAQARELSREGMEIGCHTISHPVLGSLSAIAQEQEMESAKKEIEDQVGTAVTSFAIPFGNRGTYTATTLDIAARHFRVCCTTRFSTNACNFRLHRGMALLDRVEPRPEQSTQEVVDQARGKWDALRWIQRPYRGGQPARAD